MRAKGICICVICMLAIPVYADIVTVSPLDLAGCEDIDDQFMGSQSCSDLAPNAYIGYNDWWNLGMIFSYEGTKVCFDISSLAGCTVSAVYFTYDGVGDPTGLGLAFSGPAIVRSYAPFNCDPFCGNFLNPCSLCPGGNLYLSGIVQDGLNQTLLLADQSTDQAALDLQTAIDLGDDCFCVCIEWALAANYEVRLDNILLDVDAVCGPTSTPTEVPTSTPTQTPIPSNTPLVTMTPTHTPGGPTPTPPAIPATSPLGMGIMVLFVSVWLAMGFVRRRK
jgi:hypothetical protein